MRIPRLYRLLRIFRLFKLVRVLKVSKFDNMGKLLRLSNSIKTIAQNIFFILFLTHLMGCFWFLQAKMTDFPDDCWVVGGDFLYTNPGK